MKVTLTKNKKWWQVWISKKPIELFENKDYLLDGGCLILNKKPKRNDKLEVVCEYVGGHAK